jgi:hypothetical protein
MVVTDMQKQKGSLITLVAVILISVTIGLVWVHLTNKPPRVQAGTAATAKRQAAPDGCANNASGKTVLVSISQQHMWACEGADVIKQSVVTTGASNAPNGVNDSTPLGTWHVYEKFRNLYLKGHDANGPWNDYVQYWMPFDTAVGFHDASWQTFPFGSDQYKTNGSHGCVQLPTSVAAWLYGWAPVGTKVVVSA